MFQKYIFQILQSFFEYIIFTEIKLLTLKNTW